MMSKAHVSMLITTFEHLLSLKLTSYNNNSNTRLNFLTICPSSLNATPVYVLTFVVSI